MGSCLTHPSAKVDAQVDSFSRNTEFPINKQEIALLRDSWTDINSKWNTICGIAFSKWLATYPEVKYIFKNLANDLKTHNVYKAPSILLHAQRFEELIEAVLNNLHNQKELISTVITIGKLHHTSFGATQMYATALANGLILAIYSECNLNVETQNAWSSLITFLADMIKTGMRLAINDEKVLLSKVKILSRK